MTKIVLDLKEELVSLKLVNGIIKKKNCSADECKLYKDKVSLGEELSENIIKDSSDPELFYEICENNLTKEEELEYIRLKQLNHIRIIKNCVVFFTVIAIISLLLSAIHFNSLL